LIEGQGVSLRARLEDAERQVVAGRVIIRTGDFRGRGDAALTC
jgi:hypothetical protein